MSNKVDMFSATRELSDRVAEYMTVTCYNATLKTRYKRDIEEWDAKIADAPRLLEGSILAENLPALLEGYKAERQKIVDHYAELRDKADRFTLLECDKEFYKAYSEGHVKEGLIAWAKTWNLDIDDTDFLKVLIYAVGGVRQATAKTIITSGATEFTSERTRNDVLKTMYAIFAEKMILVGTLKPCQLDEDVVEYYKNKKKAKTSK